MKFKVICLKQDSVSFLHKKVANLYISCELDTWSEDLNTNFTLGNCLFEAVKLTKNADPDKDKYSGYCRGFDSRSKCSGSVGRGGMSFLELMIVLCILMVET